MIIEKIKLEALIPLSYNSGLRTSGKNIVSLVISVLYFGLLTPLIVEITKKGKYAVVEGNRRLYAILELFKRTEVLTKKMEDEKSEKKRKTIAKKLKRYVDRTDKLREGILCLVREETDITEVCTEDYYRETNNNLRKHNTEERLDLLLNNPKKKKVIPKSLVRKIDLVKRGTSDTDDYEGMKQSIVGKINISTLFSTWTGICSWLSLDFKKYENKELEEDDNESVEDVLNYLIDNGDSLILIRDNYKSIKPDKLKKAIDDDDSPDDIFVK